MKHILNLFSGEMVVKVLLALTLALLAINVYNYQVVKTKTAEIDKLVSENKTSNERIELLAKDIERLSKMSQVTEKAIGNVSRQVKTLENKEKDYSNKVKGLQSDEQTKTLLDTQLTDDLRRLLDNTIDTSR